MLVVRGRRSLATIFGIFLLPALLTDCTLAVDADRVQCRTNDDCTSRGGAFTNANCVDSLCEANPAWACLSTPAAPSPQTPPYRIAVSIRDLVSAAPVPGAQVNLCRKLDVDCATPVSTAVSDSDGGVTFSVSTAAFAGYLAVQAVGTVPALYFFNPDIDRDQAVSISVAAPAAYVGLLLQLERQPSPGHGNVVISALDCTGAPAAGVSYSTLDGDDMTSPFYTLKGLPTLTAKATDAVGYGGLINVPAGTATVTTTLASPPADLGMISLLVREGAITYARVVPSAK